MKKIAVLMTCFNRVRTTLRCLDRLYAQGLPEGYSLDVWLVDDASPDRTGEAVKGKFPQVHVIRGTGDLYWCRGMRLAWDRASASHDYDFYLWLNDDVVLYRDALSSLIADYLAVGGGCSIIAGSFYEPGTTGISYGGRIGGRFVVPNGAPARFETGMNGNLVLVPMAVFRKIGGLSRVFHHSAGDYEYGLRAAKNGVRLYVGSRVAGECALGPRFEKKRLREMGIGRRFGVLFSPTGLGLSDYCKYKYLVFGFFPAFSSFSKWILICLFPRVFWGFVHDRG